MSHILHLSCISNDYYLFRSHSFGLRHNNAALVILELSSGHTFRKHLFDLNN